MNPIRIKQKQIKFLSNWIIAKLLYRSCVRLVYLIGMPDDTNNFTLFCCVVRITKLRQGISYQIKITEQKILGNVFVDVSRLNRRIERI